MTRLVLWDIDGTLVDTAGHGRDAFGEAFAAVFGRSPGGFDGLSMAGRTDHAITVALLERAGVADGDAHLAPVLDELAAALAARAERIAAEGSAKPGARSALEAVAREPGVTQSVLTGNIEPNAALKLAAFGLAELVDLEIGAYGSDAGARSELVGVACEKARRLRGITVSATETALVGDTPLDVEAARAAGARAVAVASGPYGRDELQGAGADTVLEDLRDPDAVLRALGV